MCIFSSVVGRREEIPPLEACPCQNYFFQFSLEVFTHPNKSGQTRDCCCVDFPLLGDRLSGTGALQSSSLIVGKI